ncbi:hypothetical protein HYX19_02390 [Candidatus Woesearchaeota archaeon]|nr:hypothetical protein [Candidatus Woesearchaeota archaeon]
MVKSRELFAFTKLDLTDKKTGFSIILIGILLAFLVGWGASIFNWGSTWVWWLLVLGVVAGILNIFHEEGVLFLVAVLTLTLKFFLLASLPIFPHWAVNLFMAVVYLLAPASIVVCLKVLYALATR